MMNTKIEKNVDARRAANTVVELGITVAKDEGLEPDAVRHMWKCVIETASGLIGEDSVLDAIAARKALADPERISFEDGRKELGLDGTVSDDDPFPFGTHKDTSYGEVPDSHYKWLAKQPWIDKWPDVLGYIQENDLD